MNVRLLLVILLILCFFGTPIFPYAHNWGWGWPGGIGGLVLLLLILSLLGVL